MIATRIAAALGAAFVSSALLAADSALEPPDLERYLRWGPFRVRPGVELADAGYDDNILSNSVEPVDDYTATVYGKLEGLMLFGSRAFLAFDERLGYRAYLDNTDQSYPIQDGFARVTVPFERLGVFVEGRMVRDSDRPIDREDVRPDRSEDVLGAGLILEPGWRTSIELSTNDRRWRYTDPDYLALGGQSIGEQLDRDELFWRVRARYRWKGRTSLLGDAHTGEIAFLYPDPLGQQKDSDEWSANAGIEIAEGGPLTGRVLVGWQRINALDPARADYQGVIGRAEVAYRPLGRTTLRLEAERRPGFSVYVGSTYYLDRHADLTAVHYVNRIVGVELGGGLARLTFPGSVVAAEREDDITRYSAAVRLRLSEDSIGRRVEYRLYAQRHERSSPLPSANISRTIVGLGATVGF